MFFEQPAPVIAADLIPLYVVPDYVHTQPMPIMSNFTHAHNNFTNTSANNHSAHSAGLYTKDGRRVVVEKDRGDEEDDVSFLALFFFYFNGIDCAPFFFGINYYIVRGK